ncbi:MAG: hypothetical protein IOD12_02475 [Silvanigrellales bacterium]|nr:hypothetical protein [Silvanigrellales bacterium]
MAAVVSPPIEVQQPAPVKSDTQSALWSSFLPDSLSYIVRHKVLGFALARGVSVESRLETDGPATWLLSWSALKLAPVQNKQPWEFSFGVSPYFNTYQLNQTYVFRLQGNDGKVFRSRYEIGQFQAYALAKAAGTWRLPGGALEFGVLAGPSFIWWEDSLGVFGRKLQLTWGPSLSYVAFLPWNTFLRGSFEVFSISRGQAIGSSAYQISSYQVSSLGLGWRFW